MWLSGQHTGLEELCARDVQVEKTEGAEREWLSSLTAHSEQDGARVAPVFEETKLAPDNEW